MAFDQYEFYSRPDYFRRLAKEISETRKGGRIALASMTFEPDQPLVAAIFEELNKAAQRGVNVLVVIDAFHFINDKKQPLPGPLWYNPHKDLSKAKGPYLARYQILESLRQSGGRYAITNRPKRPFSIPQSGRSHIKTALINNKIYIGGHNLDHQDHVDIMVGWQDQPAADWMVKLLEDIAGHGSVRDSFAGKDKTLQVSPDATLYIDAGVPKQSVILDEAYKFIGTAQKRIFFTCQYSPGGKTAKHLLSAKRRGVKVEIIYTNPGDQGKEAIGHYAYNFRERLRLPAEFFKGQRRRNAPYLHAKLIATEQGAFLGSHNFVTQGVNLGTAEIALLVKNERFALEAVEFMQKQL